MECLIEELLARDTIAFEKFFNIHKDVIYQYAHKHCKDEMIAKDIVQDVFVRFWEKIEHLDNQKNIDAYLYTIAKNLVLEELRKKALSYKYENYITSSLPNQINSIEITQNYRELEIIYQDAIEVLPEKRREIYKLSKIKNLSNQEISSHLNISTNTVRDQLVKAGKAVRAYVRKKITYFF